jgi:hypothetical protein
MRPKLNSLHDNRVKRGCVSDPTPWRYSSTRNSAKMESWEWVRTARSLGIEDDAERRRRHSHAEHGNECEQTTRQSKVDGILEARATTEFQNRSRYFRSPEVADELTAAR